MAEALTNTFWSFVQTSVSDDGFSLHHGLVMNRDGKLTVLAMALDAEQVYQTVLSTVAAEQAPAAVFAIDRFAKDGQGTKHGDLLAGHSFANHVWRPFIIEYRIEPRIVEPIDFDNAWWNAALTREMHQFRTRMGFFETRSSATAHV